MKNSSGLGRIFKENRKIIMLRRRRQDGKAAGWKRAIIAQNFFFFPHLPHLLRSKRPFRTKIYTFANKIGGGSRKIINETPLSAIKEFATI